MMQKRILIIEDNQELAESLVDILEMAGYDVQVTSTGNTGLQAALTTQPDLIILDIHLPDMDGYDVLQRLQADAWGATARVLILTASESVEQIAKNTTLPRQFVLFKPEISVVELQQKIEERLAAN